jgi:hypothetical protein
MDTDETTLAHGDADSNFTRVDKPRAAESRGNDLQPPSILVCPRSPKMSCAMKGVFPRA